MNAQIISQIAARIQAGVTTRVLNGVRMTGANALAMQSRAFSVGTGHVLIQAQDAFTSRCGINVCGDPSTCGP